MVQGNKSSSEVSTKKPALENKRRRGSKMSNRRVSASNGSVSAPLRRAAQIVEVVSTAAEGLALNQIASMVGLPPSTTHRLVKSLLAIGYLALNEDRRTYFLGSRLVHVMHAAFGSKNIQALVEPILSRLVLRFGQVFYVNHLIAEKARVVAFVMPEVVERALVIPGEYSPIHATAGGKAIFAFQDQAVIGRQLSQPLKKILPNTVTDPVLVRKELERVRKQGYALTRSEFGMGVTAIAVPVDLPDAGVVYSIGMAGFESHLFDRYSLRAYVNALRHAASEFRSVLAVAHKRTGSSKRGE